MTRILLLLAIATLASCAVAPLDIHRAPLNEARHLIAQAKAAGAEQCAPKEQAIAVANLQAAAHELGESDSFHWQNNLDPLQLSIRSANAALQKCANMPPSFKHHLAAISQPDQPTIYFAYKSATLSRQAQNKLLHFVAIIAPTETFSIEGHADERGGKRFNQQLSQQRAQTVADFLRHHTIARKQIVHIIGFGTTRPVANGHDEFAWHLNRRTEIRRLMP